MTKRRWIAKQFSPGQTVEVQRDVGTAWESARYVKHYPDWKGWHAVELHGAPRYVDPATGFTADQAASGLAPTRHLSVPTQRVRTLKKET